MKTSGSIVRGVFVLIMFVLASCAGPRSDESSVQTRVAGTLQALTPSLPLATPTAELPAATANPLSSPAVPTATAAGQPPVSVPNVIFEGISFKLDYQLANAWTYEITSLPDPASDNPFQAPSLYQLDFQGFVGEDSGQGPAWRTPRLYVIPVANMQSFPGGGYGLDELSQLQQILSAKPAVIAENMPVLPYSIHFDNGESFHSNVQYVNFQNGSGVRFLVEYAQTAFPAGRTTAYIFQGLTNDGKYYVSFTLPVSYSALDEYNAPYSNVGSDQAAWEAFSANYSAYVLGVIEILDATPNASFSPDLARLDAMVQSLSVKP